MPGRPFPHLRAVAWMISSTVSLGRVPSMTTAAGSSSGALLMPSSPSADVETLASRARGEGCSLRINDEDKGLGVSAEFLRHRGTHICGLGRSLTLCDLAVSPAIVWQRCLVYRLTADDFDSRCYWRDSFISGSGVNAVHAETLGRHRILSAARGTDSRCLEQQKSVQLAGDPGPFALALPRAAGQTGARWMLVDLLRLESSSLYAFSVRCLRHPVAATTLRKLRQP